ncbi:MAG: phosphoenolpyruvate carboxykinase (GTP), partial [Promethearchaeota archaeon]
MERIDQLNIDKLNALNNEYISRIVDEFVKLCKPNKVTVITDSSEDIEYCKQKAIQIGEEAELKTQGHTIHYDGFYSMSDHDQARDKENTKVLIP